MFLSAQISVIWAGKVVVTILNHIYFLFFLFCANASSCLLLFLGTNKDLVFEHFILSTHRCQNASLHCFQMDYGLILGQHAKDVIVVIVLKVMCYRVPSNSMSQQ